MFPRIKHLQASWAFRRFHSKACLNVLFIGSDELVSLPVLRFLCSEYPKLTNVWDHVSCHVLTRVVTQNLNPVAKYCNKHGLPLINWDEIEKEKRFESLCYDVGVLSSFGKLIPKELINAMKYGIVNVHPSMLPRWRGSSPLPKTILTGDRLSGVSLMLLSPNKFDQGKIIAQKSFEVPEDFYTEDLAELALDEGKNLLLGCLDNLEDSIANARPQSKEGITYALKLNREDAFVDWNQRTVSEVWKLHRALSFKYPIKTCFNGKSVKLTEMVQPKYTVEGLIPSYYFDNKVEPGTVCVSPLLEAICIKCVDGFVGFKKVQIGGRRQLDALNFANGYFNQPGTCLRFTDTTEI